ncbi:MAG: hypothetical protein AB7P04_13905 [Bacteriovoracia bacterium]
MRKHAEILGKWGVSGLVLLLTAATQAQTPLNPAPTPTAVLTTPSAGGMPQAILTTPSASGGASGAPVVSPIATVSPETSPSPAATDAVVVPPDTEVLKPAPEIAGPPETVKGWPPGSDFHRVEGQTIHFVGPSKDPQKGSSPHPLKTRLHGIEYLGMLHSQDGGFPYLMVKATECEKCVEKHLYLIRADGSSFTTLVLPGKVNDRKTGALLLDASSFFGHCLNGKRDVYVSFQREKVDRRRHLQTSVMVVEVKSDHLHEKLLVKRLPHIRETLRRVRLKQCTEIKGENRDSIHFEIPTGNNKKDVT